MCGDILEPGSGCWIQDPGGEKPGSESSLLRLLSEDNVLAFCRLLLSLLESRQGSVQSKNADSVLNLRIKTCVCVC